MAMQQYDGVVVDTTGVPSAGRAVTVRVLATGAVATIYSDEVFTPVANPLTTDAVGRFWFYALDGDYRIIADEGLATEHEITDVTLYSGIAREQILRKADALPDKTNSIVLEADSTLVFAVAANETWEFRIQALVTAAAAAGFDWDFTVPAGTTYTRKESWLWDGTTIRAVATSTLGTEDSYTGGGAALAGDILVIQGLIVNGATAGNVQFRYAQNIANVSQCTVDVGSYLIARRVGA